METKGKILVVESARGFAALYVLLHHVRNIGDLGGMFPAGKYAMYLLDFGPQMVLLFFFLSGFSIHYSSRHRMLERRTECVQFFYLRFRRIYPLFVLALGLTLLLGFAAPRIDPENPVYSRLGPHLIGTLFFLSDIHDGRLIAPPQNNPALWSLSYEVAYYLIYPLFFRVYKMVGIEKAFLASLLFSGIFAGIGLYHPNHLSNVFSLYWLWTGGALLAEWRIERKAVRVDPVPYYCLVFAAFCASRGLARVAPATVCSWMDGLFIGLIMASFCLDIEELSRRKRAVGVGTVSLLLAVVILSTGDLPTLGRHVFLEINFALLGVALMVLMAGGFDVRTWCRAALHPFFKAGAWSYALYIIHMPFLCFLGSVFHQKYLRLAAILLAVPAICWLALWLELKVQPRIASRLDACWSRMRPFLAPAHAG